MVLKGCISLLEVHQSIGQHKKLVILSLEGCLNLKILPKKLEMNSLKNFILSGCPKVKKLPEFGDGMKSLSMLDLKDCENLLCLPNSINNLKSLKILNISNCSKFSRMPNNLNQNEVLEELDASGTAIKEVPSSIIHLKNLQKVSFRGCKGSPSNFWDLCHPFRWFQQFQRQQNSMSLVLPSISRMLMLTELDLSYCNLGDGSIFDNLGTLSSLHKLDLQGNSFLNLPTYCIASLSKLDKFDVRDCARLQSLPILPLSLTSLGVTGCTSMDFVSYSQHLCDLFASKNSNLERFDWPYCHLSIPGSEIPTWFDNQNYCSKDFLISAFPESYGDYDSIISIIVDIPHHYCSSGYWGIALCLALEYISPSDFREGDINLGGGYIKLMSKAREADFPNPLFGWGSYSVKEFNYPFLYIDYLSSKFVKGIKRACDKDSLLELTFCSRYSSLHKAKGKTKLKIRECGYRILWKDNGEICSNASTETKGCQRDGVEEDEATLSISNPGPSKRAKLL